jgi:hypothetical protein
MNRIALTLWLLLVAMLMPLAAANQDTIPQDSIPQDTIPQDSIPQDSTFLTLVDTLRRGDRIVIERNGFVLDEQSPKSGALLSTRTFLTANLTGGETYLWTLVQGLQGFYLCGSRDFYVNESGGSFSLNYDAPSTQWIFEFAEDSTATIYTSDKKRFIGETAVNSGMYKPYSKSYLSAYGHTFRIYRLDRPQPVDPDPTAITSPTPDNPNPATKLLHDGRLVILKNGIRYSILGQPLF